MLKQKDDYESQIKHLKEVQHRHQQELDREISLKNEIQRKLEKSEQETERKSKECDRLS